jgi:hypothetical protein
MDSNDVGGWLKEVGELEGFGDIKKNPGSEAGTYI